VSRLFCHSSGRRLNISRTETGNSTSFKTSVWPRAAAKVCEEHHLDPSGDLDGKACENKWNWLKPKYKILDGILRGKTRSGWSWCAATGLLSAVDKVWNDYFEVRLDSPNQNFSASDVEYG
jgi:hypothetical protein